MKRIYKKLCVISLGLAGALSANAQTQTAMPAVNSALYQQMKLAGTLPNIIHQSLNTSKTKNTNTTSQIASVTSTSTPGNCACMVAIDSGFSDVPFAGYAPPYYSNDDASSAAISLPFTFCYYGDTVNSIFINNNGNISFSSPYSAFTASGFPSSAFNMIAPFWGDVDTRNINGGSAYYDSLSGTWVNIPGASSLGRVRYKVTPTALIVKWDSVGYFPNMADKRNTFQLIITDGIDPLVPGGNNVAFCYGDMQWTTGSASQGTNGFGGTASTTGINKGDGINYFQVTRNDQPGNAYDGPYGANDGIDYLDNKAYYFTTCASTNIPPISLTDICDTLTMDMGDDSTIVQYVFIGPEPGQTVNLSMAPNPDAIVLSNISGVVATLTVQINNTGNRSSANDIVVTATDNGGSTSTQTTAVIQPTFTHVKNSNVNLFSITPNPSTGVFTVKGAAKNASIKVVNIIGEVVLNDNTNANTNLNIDLSTHPNGVYFVQLFNGTETITRKLIKE